MCLYLQNMKKKKKKNDIPANAGQFLITEIHSTDFKNKKLTTNTTRNKAGKQCFSKKFFQKILTQTKPSNKISI